MYYTLKYDPVFKNVIITIKTVKDISNKYNALCR